MPIWYNNDGLLIKSGRDEAVSGSGGTYVDYVAGNQIYDFTVDLTRLSTTPLILDDYIRYPKGWKIEQVETFVEVAAAGGTSLSIGFVQSDRATVVDNGAILAAIPVANLTVGKRATYRIGDTGAGTRVGLAEPIAGDYITGTVAGTFTAGIVKVRLFTHRP
jgi:Ca2+-binding RTX toxin-like protein